MAIYILYVWQLMCMKLYIFVAIYVYSIQQLAISAKHLQHICKWDLVLTVLSCRTQRCNQYSKRSSYERDKIFFRKLSLTKKLFQWSSIILLFFQQTESPRSLSRSRKSHVNRRKKITHHCHYVKYQPKISLNINTYNPPLSLDK